MVETDLLLRCGTAGNNQSESAEQNETGAHSKPRLYGIGREQQVPAAKMNQPLVGSEIRARESDLNRVVPAQRRYSAATIRKKRFAVALTATSKVTVVVTATDG